MSNCTLITRTFQPIKEIKDYDEKKFLETFVEPLKKLINNTKSINQIIIVLNGDTNSKYSEKADENGNLPSQIAFNKIKNEINKNIDIKIVICKNWGLNQGSASALNDALNTIKDTDIDDGYFFIWSSGMNITAEQFENSLKIVDEDKIDVMGYLRDGFMNNYAWRVPQNTACFWKKDKLIEFKFSKECDGKENVNINIDGQNILLAGMEDYYTLIKMFYKYPELKVAMIGKNNPIYWNNPNTQDNINKVLRQEKVMDKYLEDLSIELNFNKESFKRDLEENISMLDF